MNFYCKLLLLLTLLGCTLPITTQANPNPTNPESLADCPQPALSRLIRHKVAPGETLENIAQQYNLIPATLMGMNPGLQNGEVAVGSEILLPPYNGIRIEVLPGQTLQQVAEKYNVRPDVLFEVNGCQAAPKVVFVPGVNWSPQRPPVDAIQGKLAGYPLTSIACVFLC